MKKIRACFIITDAMSYDLLCRGQFEYFRSRANLDLTLICGGKGKDLEILGSRNLGRVLNIGLVRRPSLWRDVLSSVRLIAHFFANRYDLVVYSTPKALLLGSLSAWLTGQPKRIAIIRGRVYENFSGIKRSLYTSFDYLACRVSHRTLFISASLRSIFIQERIVTKEKSEVIANGSSNGIDVTRFNRATINRDKLFYYKELFQLSDSDFVIITVGRICVDKGIADIAQIADNISLPQVKFIFVGDIEDKASERILHKLKARPNIFHLAATTDIPELFAISDLHLFLSHREGFGNVAIEAAACEVPTFAFDVVGVRDSVAEGISGSRFDPHDINSIISSIHKAANNKALFKTKYKNSRTWAIQNFSNKTVWDDYLRLYARILSR